MSNSYKVTVIAGTKVVADMVQKVSQSTIEASLEVKPIPGGATEAAAVLLPAPNPLPVNSNRKMTKVVGWFKNATGPAWEAPKDFDNTNWWSYETGLWSLGSSVPMPIQKGVDIINPNGTNIPSERGTARYAPSKANVGIISVELNQNLAEKYNNADQTDTSLFEINTFYDKRNGTKGVSTDFISTYLDDIVGGMAWDYSLYLYNFASVCFFDANSVFLFSISTTSATWADVVGTVNLAPNVAKVGFTFPKNIPAKRASAFLKAKESKTVTTASVFIPSSQGVKKSDVVSLVSNTGAAVVNEEAVRKFAVSFDLLGIKQVKSGENLISKYAQASATDATIFDIGSFFDKRNGNKLNGTEFLASKILEPIQGGHTYEYYFRLYGYAGVCFYDIDDKFLFSIAPATNDATWVTLTGSIDLPVNVAKVGYTFPKGFTDGRTNAYIRPISDIIVVSNKVFQPVQTPDPDPEPVVKEDLVSMGDSIREFGPIPQLTGTLLGYNGINCGVGGTKWTPHPTANYDKLSAFQIVDAIVTGDFTSVNTALDNLIVAAETGTPVDIGKANRLRATKKNLNETDFSKVEIFTLSYGTNDYTGANPIGAMSLSNKDVTTIVGSINYCIEKLTIAFPNLKIFLTTPTHRMIGTSPTWVSSDVHKNSIGIGLKDVCDAIEQAAALNHVPCKNHYREGFFNVYNHVTYFSDAVHPRSIGNTLMAREEAGFIKSKLF